MSRHMVDVYTIEGREPVVIDIPPPLTHAGSRHGQIRSRLVDDDGEWWFECSFITDASSTIDTFPVSWCRRPTVADFEGWAPGWAVEEMKASGELADDEGRGLMSDPAPTVEP